jgi:hypothetical protein
MIRVGRELVVHAIGRRDVGVVDKARAASLRSPCPRPSSYRSKTRRAGVVVRHAVRAAADHGRAGQEAGQGDDAGRDARDDVRGLVALGEEDQHVLRLRVLGWTSSGYIFAYSAICSLVAGSGTEASFSR